MILLGTLLDLNLGTKNLGAIAEPDTSPRNASGFSPGGRGLNSH